MPKLSVIIPIYGVEKYIQRCARSLFEQTLNDIEFIFINDCTRDSSMSLLDDILKEYTDKIKTKGWTVKVTCMPKNSGLPAVRKYGISLSSGEYIAHCDSDDWTEPTLYQELYDTAKKNDLDIVWCGYNRTDGHVFIPKSDSGQRELMQGPVWNKIVKRSIYTDHSIEYPTASKAEDGALMTQLSFYAKSRVYVNMPLYNYFINVSSITGQKDEASCLRKLEQEKQNVDLRVSFLERENALKGHEVDVIMWKYAARENLKPLLGRKKFRILWRGTYQEINSAFLKSKQISIRTKFAFLQRYFGIVCFHKLVDFKKLVFQSGGDRRGAKAGVGKVKF